MTTNLSFLQWLSDPSWLSMEATVRGFHAQLLLISTQTRGIIVDDEATWRQWLGLPPMTERSTSAKNYPILASKWIAEGTPDRLTEIGGSGLLLEHYWTNQWLPALRKVWTPVSEGKVTCSLAQKISQAEIQAEPTGQLVSETVTSKPPRKTKPKKSSSSITLSDFPMEHWLNEEGVQAPAIAFVNPMNHRFFNGDDILGRWNLPVERHERINLWTMAGEVLKTGTEEDKKISTVIGLAIKQYGEKPVLEALMKLGQRTIRPSNPKNFFFSILKNSQRGFEGQQLARKQRSDLVL